MDEDLKKLVQQIQAQKLGEVVVPENQDLSIQDYANMEPPRVDYSEKPKQFPNIKNYINNLNNAVSPSEVAQSPSRVEVYPSEQQQMSNQEKAIGSIKQSILDPNANVLDNIRKQKEQIKKLTGM